MNARTTRIAPKRPPAGFTLLAILLMTAVVALLALAAMNSSIMQERMAGNARDKNIAMQAAEAALRDAERDVENNLDPTSGFSVACTSGLCMPPSMTASGPQSAPLWQSINWSTQSTAYGARTGAAALLGPGNTALASQPQYFVEMLPSLPATAGGSVCQGCTNVGTSRARAYRITVRAFGVRSSTVVMLQSVYVKQ